MPGEAEVVSVPLVGLERVSVLDTFSDFHLDQIEFLDIARAKKLIGIIKGFNTCATG